MADWPAPGSGTYATVGVTAGSTTGITITTGASAFGAWSELVASTSFPAWGALVHVIDNSAATDYAVQLGVGAAGSEQGIFILKCATARATQVNSGFLSLVPIASGTRVAARAASGASTNTITVLVTLLGGGHGLAPFAGRSETYGGGVNTTATIDPGATANTKGAWVELTASTAFHARWIVIMFTNRANTTHTTARWLVDIGIGAAGSEQTIFPNLGVNANTTSDDIYPGVLPPLPVNIPTGTRIAARAQCSITDATDRLLGCAVAIFG